jgi:hypothetical protein
MLSPVYFISYFSLHILLLDIIFALSPLLHTAHISLDIPSLHIALLDILDIIICHLEFHRDEDVTFFLDMGRWSSVCGHTYSGSQVAM